MSAPLEFSDALEVGNSDKIVATTKVSIPQGDGPIHATSVIEAVPQTGHMGMMETAQLPSDSNSDDRDCDIRSQLITPRRRSTNRQEEFPTPSAPPLHEINGNQKLLLNLQGRQHAFTSKTVLRSDTCTHCLKK